MARTPITHSRLAGAGAQAGPAMARTPDNCDYASVSVTSAKRFGFWPCGLWTLAVWRCLICASSRLGVGGYQDRMVCNLSSPRLLQPVTGASRVTRGGWPQPSTLQVYACPLVFSLPLGAVPAFEPRRLERSRMRRAVEDSAEQGWDWYGPGSSARTFPPPRSAYLNEDRRAAPLYNNHEGRPHREWTPAWRASSRTMPMPRRRGASATVAAQAVAGGPAGPRSRREAYGDA